MLMCRISESPCRRVPASIAAFVSRTLPDESNRRPLPTPSAVCARHFNVSTFSSNLTFTAAVLPLSNPTDTVIDVLHEAISDPWRTTNKVCWTVLVLSELGPLASGPSCYPFLKEDGTVVMAPSKPIHTKASVNFYWWDRYLALLEPASVFEPWAGIWG